MLRSFATESSAEADDTVWSFVATFPVTAQRHRVRAIVVVLRIFFAIVALSSYAHGGDPLLSELAGSWTLTEGAASTANSGLLLASLSENATEALSYIKKLSSIRVDRIAKANPPSISSHILLRTCI